jgi:hypothetical protein
VRALAVLGCVATLLVLAPAARSVPDPRAAMFRAISAWRSPPEDEQLARLRSENRRLAKANRYHARWVRKLRRANHARLAFGSFGIVQGFLCIHFNRRTGRGEGAWDDPDPPYWGGVQMDLSFQRTYGLNFLRALGTADHWPPFVQVAVAMSAYYAGRGFHPWPRTARSCGLL